MLIQNHERSIEKIIALWVEHVATLIPLMQ